ncbi:NADH-quinone oxidoreductase subunit N [Actinocatenispora thailandica]|uniref:NADH-quinone oxidoreductase subunit N n=1 Tax=Actinocatenispora thailandica TaxID=227318 RepID=UPI0031D74F08
MTGLHEDPGALLPELALAVAAVAGLLAGSWLPRRRQWLVRLLGAIGCTVGIAAAVVAATGPARTVFGGSYAVDTGLAVARVVILAGTLLVLAMAGGTLSGHRRETEFVVLLLLAALGAMVLAGTDDLLLLIAGYLLASVPLYALTAFDADPAGTEAALKYYLIGALFGVVLMLGVAALLAAGGGTDYPTLARTLPGAPPVLAAAGFVGVFGGLLFKAGGAPAQFWVPDVAEGAGTPVAAFVTTIPKIGALIAAYRLLDVAVPGVAGGGLLVAAVAAGTMTLGNLAAFAQTNPRRLLAYSTISQVGYLLMAVAAAGHAALALPGLGFYLAGYAVTNIGAFAVLAALPSATLDGHRGLFGRRPVLALALVICLLGLVGTPPTAIFVGKLSVFTAAFDANLLWLVVVAAANTLASLYYYLRWIVPLFQRDGAPHPTPAGRWPAAVAVTAAAGSLALGLAAEPVVHALSGHLLR